MTILPVRLGAGNDCLIVTSTVCLWSVPRSAIHTACLCCPVSGGWSSWQEYTTGSCSRTCGGGKQTVTLQRWCNSPSPSCNGASCHGSSTTTEQRSCNGQSCPGENLVCVKTKCDNVSYHGIGSSFLPHNQTITCPASFAGHSESGLIPGLSDPQHV